MTENLKTLFNKYSDLKKIKFEFKIVAAMLLALKINEIWKSHEHSTSEFLLSRAFLFILALILLILIVDFIKEDKQEYVKNSLYVDYRKHSGKQKFSALAKGTEFIFDSITLIGISVILTFIIDVFMGFGIKMYLISSIFGGTYILFMVWILRKKLLDERIAYIEEISNALDEMMSGNLNVSAPELTDHPFCSLAQNINKIKRGYGTALEEKIKSESMKTQLITNVSHDLKTPLTSIISYIDLLKKEDLSPEHTKDYVLILEKKSQRLHVLIQDLFEVTSASSGDIQLYLEDLDVAQLLHQTVAELDADISKSQTELILDIPSSFLILADGHKLHRVFENLIVNALKYSLSGSRIYIDMKKTDEQTLAITFKNTANYHMDFDPEDMLARFTRADSARTSEGSGLGLAIAQSFLELMNMKIELSVDGDLFKARILIPLQELTDSKNTL